VLQDNFHFTKQMVQRQGTFFYRHSIKDCFRLIAGGSLRGPRRGIRRAEPLYSAVVHGKNTRIGRWLTT
jgi:hypothetical protein